jgi:hypothetical protein
MPRVFPEPVPIEENQDAAMEPGETYSPSLLLCQIPQRFPTLRAPDEHSVNSLVPDLITIVPEPRQIEGNQHFLIKWG